MSDVESFDDLSGRIHHDDAWRGASGSLVEGRVVDISKTSGPVLIAVEQDGHRHLAFLPPFSMLSESGVNLLTDEPIRLHGNWNGDVLYVHRFEYEGDTVTARDEHGAPAW